MVGRKRKVVENEESIVKKKPVTKKDLEDLVQLLRQELETEKGKVVILDEEVLQFKQKIEEKQKQVEDCKKEIEELKKSKEAVEIQIQKDTSSKNQVSFQKTFTRRLVVIFHSMATCIFFVYQQKSSTRKIVETSEEDESLENENNDVHDNTTNEVRKILSEHCV